MKNYSIYDINIISEVDFKNLSYSNKNKYDLKIVTVRKSPITKDFKVYRKINLKGRTWVSFFKSNCDYAIRFHKYADFVINKNNCLVSSYKRKDTTQNTFSHLILDQILPYALTLLGKMVFHASTVKIGNTAISFQAPSGFGKSTLAAYFSTKKYELLTDDLLVLEEKNNKIYTHTGYPGIRLWPNNIKNIFKQEIKTKEVSQFNTKRILTSNINFTKKNTAVQLKSIYFINNCNHTDIERLNPSEAFSQIINNIFRLNSDNKEINKNQFVFINKLLRNTDFFRLNYEKKYESLEKVYKLVTTQNQN